MSDTNMSIGNSTANAARMVIGENSLPRLELIQEEAGKTEDGNRKNGILANHGGKLAIGVAAMLGLAIFYKWREQELSAEDPDDSASLQRIKKIVDADKPAEG